LDISFNVSNAYILQHQLPRCIAIKRNQEIVSRRQHADTPVHAGDVIEIVQAIGGG